MRIRLAIWLVLMSMASAACATVCFGGLVMSPMIFTSRKVFEDPKAWLFIGGIAVAMLVFLALIALQWILFALKKNRGALIVSLHPILPWIFYTWISAPVMYQRPGQEIYEAQRDSVNGHDSAAFIPMDSAYREAVPDNWRATEEEPVPHE